MIILWVVLRRLLYTCKGKKVKFSHTCYQALGPELILVYRQSTRRWLSHPPGGRLLLLSAWACGDLHSWRTSLPIGRYQIILLGIWVWTTCPRLLLDSSVARAWTHNHWVTSVMPYPLDYWVIKYVLYTCTVENLSAHCTLQTLRYYFAKFTIMQCSMTNSHYCVSRVLLESQSWLR